RGATCWRAWRASIQRFSADTRARAKQRVSCSTNATRFALSESKIDREQIAEPAEIDRRHGVRRARCESLIGRQLAFGRLMPQLEPECDLVERHANAAEDERPDLRSTPLVRLAEDAVVARVDPFTGF